MATPVSEDAELDRARQLLTDTLIRVPRRPSRAHEEHWRAALDVEPRLGGWPEGSPVAGVATTLADGRPEIVVFLEHESDIDAQGLGDALGVGFPVRTFVTGAILPAARPAQGGDSLSGDGPGGDTGTLGCVVRSTTSGDRLILGCNHTLAGVNRCAVNHDTVRHPGAGDGGTTPADTLGTLTRYHPIVLGGYQPNIMDAAVAEPTAQAHVVSGVRGIDVINGVGMPLGYEDRLQKVGWKTGHTFGTFRFKLSYETEFPGVGPALFVDQYGIVGDDADTYFAQQGDSGAAVLTEDSCELVGMIIGVAGGQNLAIASPIDPILAAFAVEPAYDD